MRFAVKPLKLAIFAFFLSIVPAGFAVASDIVRVPDGNRNAVQPAVSPHAVSRTQSTRESFEGKYQKTLKFFRKNPKLVKKIKKISKIYKIDPIHMVGAIVGEHTYNVNLVDYMQTYYYKAIEYSGLEIRFGYKNIRIEKFIKWPQFSICDRYHNSYDLWACREFVWNKAFSGKTVNGVSFPRAFFAQVFFQPFFAGQTFGLGQLSPLAALRLSDTVSKIGGRGRVKMTNAPRLYKSIMDPDDTLHYIAALVRVSIDAYRDIAGFDISNNPGITATLFNLGDVRRRAYVLKQKNEARKGSGQNLIYPQENFYGWFINDRLNELRRLL